MADLKAVLVQAQAWIIRNPNIVQNYRLVF
jgi:hypothetical protein